MSLSLSEKPRLRAFMTADAVGGVWQYALDLATELQPRGVDVTLAALGPSPSSDQLKTAEVAGVSLILTGLPLDWIAKNPEEIEEAGRILARIAAQASPDIVHLNNPALAASGVFSVPSVAVCHSCVATWWRAVRSGPLPDEFTWRAELLRKGYLAADALIAPTAAFARATADCYNLEALPVVVRNGRRVPSLEGREPQDPFAFTVGRLWDEGKNIAVLDRAASRLPIPVLAAGPVEGPNGACVGVEHVKALGKLSDTEVVHYLSIKPIFVSAARYEPFGLAVLEAAQAGCALVLSDIPTFRELWDGAAIFVQPEDVEGFTKAILSLVQNRNARTRMGQAAREIAKSYSAEDMGAGVLKVYRSLLTRKTRRSSVGEAVA